MLLIIDSTKQGIKSLNFYFTSRAIRAVINRSRSSASLAVPYRCNDMLAAPFTPARPFI